MRAGVQTGVESAKPLVIISLLELLARLLVVEQFWISICILVFDAFRVVFVVLVLLVVAVG